VIPVMTRPKMHHMAKGGTPQAAIAEKCRTSLRSVERILPEQDPILSEVAANQRQAAPRRGRPPKADPAVVEQVRALLDVLTGAIDGQRGPKGSHASRSWEPRGIGAPSS
jgi:hypothetical protein